MSAGRFYASELRLVLLRRRNLLLLAGTGQEIDTLAPFRVILRMGIGTTRTWKLREKLFVPH